MINADGERFVDEGMDFRNYTYAQFGKAILEQPGQIAWQIFDSKVMDLLYAEYRFHDAHFIEADNFGELDSRLEGVNPKSALRTIQEFNSSVDQATVFDPRSRMENPQLVCDYPNQIGPKPWIHHRSAPIPLLAASHFLMAD